MHLWIDGTQRAFISIQEFRNRYNFPDNFGTPIISPKHFTGLGSIEHADPQLLELYRLVVDYVPHQLPPDGWTGFMLRLQHHFHKQLREANAHIGLKLSEIMCAVAGFGDYCQLMGYEVMQSALPGKDAHPAFETIYDRWLSRSIEVSQRSLPYYNHGLLWHLHLVHTIYGRVGFIAKAEDHMEYVHDMHLACPAEGFMLRLFREITAKIIPWAAIDTR